MESQVTGVWRLMSATRRADDPNSDHLYGEDPIGLLTLTEDRHFTVVITRSDLPGYASGDRMSGTAEEYGSVSSGSLGLYGTYRVDGDRNFVSRHVFGSTFPNWTGMTHGSDELTIKVEGDQLTEHLDVGDGPTARYIWHRAEGFLVPGGLNEVAATWRLVSAGAAVGNQTLELFGPQPAGCVVFTDTGYFTEILHRSDLPPFTSGDQFRGSNEEQARAVQGSLIVFGTYAVDEGGTFRDETVLGSSVPNWNGTSRDSDSLTETVVGSRMTERIDTGDGVAITIAFQREAGPSRSRSTEWTPTSTQRRGAST